MNQTIATITHFVHLAAAMAAIGGTIALRFIVHPNLKLIEGDSRATFERAIRKRLTMVIHTSILLLLITGLVNVMRAFQTGREPIYTMLLFAKVLLAVGVFFIAIMLTISGDGTGTFQKHRGAWMLLNIVLGLAVVFLSATIRLLPLPQ